MGLNFEPITKYNTMGRLHVGWIMLSFIGPTYGPLPEFGPALITTVATCKHITKDSRVSVERYKNKLCWLE